MGRTPHSTTRALGGEAFRKGSSEHAAAIAALLARQWPDAIVELDHANAYQLLVATILAAQSTDKLVNTVTPALFAKYPDAMALAGADPSELEREIHSTGFFRAKARSLLGMARALVERHGGEVPKTIEELVKLPGVGRKTANVVLGNALGITAGIVVDTHVTRLSARLGLTKQTDPAKIETDLMAVLPREQWTPCANRLIWHGRRVCFAKKPDCEHCVLAPLCPSAFSFDGKPAAAKPAAAKPSGKTAKVATAAKAKVAKATSATRAKPAKAKRAKPAAKRAR